MALFNIDPNAAALKKLNRDIMDLESKKQTLIRAVQNEIAAVSANIGAKFMEIGAAAYEANLGGETSMDILADKFAEVSAYKSNIADKENQISGIVGRYDEEITLLRNMGVSPAPVTSAPAWGTAPVSAAGGISTRKCGKCGTPGNEGDMFCMKCGSQIA